MGRKHCGKRRNCSLRAISPFPTVFSKDMYCRQVKTRACLGIPSENVSGIPPEFFRDSAGITYPSRDYVVFFTFTGIPLVTNWEKSLNPGSRLWHFRKRVLNWDFHKDREFAFRSYIYRWIYLYEIYDIIKALYPRLHGHYNENIKNHIKI